MGASSPSIGRGLTPDAMGTDGLDARAADPSVRTVRKGGGTILRSVTASSALVGVPGRSGAVTRPTRSLMEGTGDSGESASPASTDGELTPAMEAEDLEKTCDGISVRVGLAVSGTVSRSCGASSAKAGVPGRAEAVARPSTSSTEWAEDLEKTCAGISVRIGRAVSGTVSRSCGVSSAKAGVPGRAEAVARPSTSSTEGDEDLGEACARLSVRVGCGGADIVSRPIGACSALPEIPGRSGTSARPATSSTVGAGNSSDSVWIEAVRWNRVFAWFDSGAWISSPATFEAGVPSAVGEEVDATIGAANPMLPESEAGGRTQPYIESRSREDTGTDWVGYPERGASSNPAGRASARALWTTPSASDA